MADTYDVLIIGAGASGLMCALECGRRGRRVAVLDHSDRPARKVRIAGGGRCNFTNLQVEARDYVGANPHFVKSALARYSPWDFIGFLGEHGLSGTEEEGGKMFCDQGGESVADALVQSAESAGARIITGVEVSDAESDAGTFHVHTSAGTFRSERLVIAAGGRSWPQVGGSNAGCSLAARFGLKHTPLRPGLVPLNAPSDLLEFCRSLAGTALPVRINSMSLQDDLLFTHTGISGPVVLDASLFGNEGQVLSLDFLPGMDISEALYEFRRMEVANALGRLVPKRLARAVCDRLHLSGNIAEMSAKSMRALESALHEFSFAPSGTGGYKKAEVTVGGVDTSEVSSKTMEAVSVPGLYILGEALDVTGRLGGFNLHWAWASGAAAGRHL